ncbi:hypothetical protein ACLOJK_032172 [Asimina triloba]
MGHRIVLAAGRRDEADETSEETLQGGRIVGTTLLQGGRCCRWVCCGVDGGWSVVDRGWLGSTHRTSSWSLPSATMAAGLGEGDGAPYWCSGGALQMVYLQIYQLVVTCMILGLEEELLSKGVNWCVMREVTGRGLSTLLVVSMVVRNHVIVMAKTSVVTTLGGAVTMSVVLLDIPLLRFFDRNKAGDDVIELTHMVRGSEIKFPNEVMVLDALNKCRHVYFHRQMRDLAGLYVEVGDVIS